jgi:hypothetical protein
MFLPETLENRVLLSAWYVSTTGSDSNHGTKAHPFQTIQHGADVAQPGDTVWIMGGTYRETVTPARSGTSAAPISFRPLSGKQKVTVDGTDPLGNFQSTNVGNSQTSAMTWDLGDGNNQLFSGGQMLPEARWPGSPSTPAGLLQPNFATVSDASIQPTSGDAMTATISVPQLTQTAGAWVGATIHISPGDQWAFQSATITASAPGRLTFNYDPFVDAPPQKPGAGSRFYLTGNALALDSSGEWFRDPNSGLLNLVGSPPTDIEAKHRLYGFDLSGFSNINISNLNLFACTVNTDNATNHITLDGITARYVSHRMDVPDPFAVKLAPHTTGIILNGSNNTLKNSTIDFSSGDGVFLGGTNNTVDNTTISNVDYAGGDEAAVTTMGAGARVTNTTIFNTGRDGIRIDQPQVRIDHNRLYNIGLLATDLGAIYAYQIDGTGSEIDHNLISAVHTGGFGAAGIYLDNGSSNFVVDHNVIWDSDFALKLNPPSTNNLVVNNTLLGTQNAVASSGIDDMTGCNFVNNIFSGAVTLGPGASQSNNVHDVPSNQFLAFSKSDYQPARRSTLIDAGSVIAPYTDGFKGRAPDIGAYEFGQKAFATGASRKRAK